MAAWTQAYYRALLVPDWRVDGANPWSAESSYTQAGPHPGVAVGANVADVAVPRMTLDVSGEYASAPATPAAAAIAVGALRGGHATRTGAGAHIGWWADALNPDIPMGWDRPGTVVGQDLLDTTTIDQSRGPALLTMPSTGAVLCAYHELTEAASNGAYVVKCRTRAASTGTWASETQPYVGTTDYTSSTASVISDHAGPALVLLPGNRVLLLTLHEDTTANTLTVQPYYSDDEGTNWYLGSPTALPASIATGTYTIRRITAAYLDGQILMFLWRITPSAGPSDSLIQYASSDLGASFVQVSDVTPAGLPSVVAVDGRFVVAYVPRSGETNADDPCWSVLGSAWSPLDEEYAETDGTKISTQAAAAYDGNSNIDQASKLAICVDEQGVLYAYWGATDLYGAIQDGTLSSTTGTWEPIGASSLNPIFDFAAGDYLREVAVTCQRGRVLLAASNTASTATTDHYLACWYLGGYTTIELPPQDLAVPWQIAATGSYANITCTWMPFELPANTGWTATGTASAETLSTSGTDWYLRVTTAANRRTYEITPTASTAGVMATAVMRSNNTVAAEVYVRASGGTGGADEYACYVRVTSTTISMIDVGSGTTRQSAAHGAGSSFVQILVHVNSGLASVWFRTYSANEARAWTLLGDAETITAQSVATTNSIAWGTNSATNDTYSVDFMYVGHVSGTAIGRGLASGAGDPHGRPIGSHPLYIYNGVFVRASGGPCVGTGNTSEQFRGDYWDINARYDYGVENLDPMLSPSPRDTWRSTQAAADESVAYRLDSVDDARMPTDLLGVHLEKVNFAQALVQVHDGSSWSTALTMTMAKQVTYARQGQSFILTYVAAGYTGVIREDELVGGALQLGTTSAAVIRRIHRNTGGTIQSSGSPRSPRVYCDLAEAGDSASGTGYLWFPRATGVVPLAVSSTHVKAIKIIADDNATFSDPPEGYFEIGQAVVGSVYLFGFNPDLSRDTPRSANIEIVEARDGRKRTRVLGPTRRRYTCSWEGVATAELYGLTDRHIVSDGTGTPVVALRHEVPALLDGLFDHMDGGHTPGVLIPNVAATGSQVILQGPVYGRFDGDLERRTVPGQGRREDADETVAVGFTWVEEV